MGGEEAMEDDDDVYEDPNQVREGHVDSEDEDGEDLLENMEQ